MKGTKTLKQKGKDPHKRPGIKEFKILINHLTIIYKYIWGWLNKTMPVTTYERKTPTNMFHVGGKHIIIVGKHKVQVKLKRMCYLVGVTTNDRYALKNWTELI